MVDAAVTGHDLFERRFPGAAHQGDAGHAVLFDDGAVDFPDLMGLIDFLGKHGCGGYCGFNFFACRFFGWRLLVGGIRTYRQVRV